MPVANELRDVLRLSLTPGLGPILISRLIDTFGSAGDALRASPRELERVRGIGSGTSASLAQSLRDSDALADGELALAQSLGVRLILKGDDEYPALLRQIPSAPPLLYVRGTLRPGDLDRYPVAIVGSRRATAYGIEQAERFAGVLARSGITIVSGGARGIDTAAHRGALRSGGRTIAILGCGLAKCYPPENEALFESIANPQSGLGGAIISELPLQTSPDSDNFPARNRLISGLCLGVIVIEAGRQSGSLITARLAAEEHNREVMAVPGRVDSAASAGTHELLKEGAAALVTDPADVLAILETPARHAHGGTHVHRYAPVEAEGGLFGADSSADDASADDAATVEEAIARVPMSAGSLPLSEAQRAIMGALEEPLTVDDLLKATGLPPSTIRSEVTILEIQRRVVRKGAYLARR